MRSSLVGKVLQVRVSATTWNEELVEKMWPNLYELAFSVPTKFSQHGVSDLIRGLDEGLKYLDWSEQRQTKMGPSISHIAQLQRDLERALADWNVTVANNLTDEIEKQLDQLEDNFVK